MEGLTHSLRVEPYPYQAEGIRFGLRTKRCIIGDEPGLGKTLQSIGVVDCAEAYPCLVICPASLKINWQREFEKFTSRKALVLDNSTLTTWPYLLRMGMFQIAVVNYESLRKFFVWDVRRRPFRLKDVVFSPDIKLFRSVIIDESHRVKDPSAQQTILAKGITEGKPYVMMLSGTPVVNRPEDLVAQLSILRRLQEFGGRQAFLDRYCGEVKQVRGDKVVREGYDNLSELSAKLYDSCLIRRKKADVLPQLPPKTRVDLQLDLADREEYDAAARDLADYLRRYAQCAEADVRRKMRMEALVKFMTLRSLAAKAKVPQAVDFIRSFLESGRQLIIFCSLHEIVDALRRAFPRESVTITGRDSQAAKQAAVDAFQRSEIPLAICSIKAAGVGLTLTAASTVMFIEFPWTYADCCQCEDRAHRIGQQDNVTCYYLLARDSIDTTLYSIIQAKKSIAAQIMASDDDIPQDEAYFDELMQSFLTSLP